MSTHRRLTHAQPDPRSSRNVRASRSATWISFDCAIRTDTPLFLRLVRASRRHNYPKRSNVPATNYLLHSEELITGLRLHSTAGGI